MWILSDRADPHGEGHARQESASDRRADPRVHEHHIVPLHELRPRSDGHQTRGQGDGMSHSNPIPRHIEDALRTNRRDFLKGAGLLAVSFGVFGGAAITAADAQTAAAQGPGPYPDPDFRQIDSWIVIHEDNTATFFVGKTDPGQGTGTGFRQLMSDELDIAFDRTTCIMGSTDITVDQVGSGGSTAMERDSWPMRRVAAEARRVLLDMASVRLGVPAAHLIVSDAVITAQADR